MLVLTRRINEVLLISKTIRITILGINRGQVKIGIEAPKEVEIVREEVLNKPPR
jgi:carbon storage regulator